MLNRENFVNALRTVLETKGIINPTIEFNNVEKPNESYEAVRIIPSDKTVGLCLNYSLICEMYEDGAGLEEVIYMLADQIVESLSEAPTFDIDLLDYDKIKDKLFIEIVGTANNETLLKNVPHTLMEDLAIVYRILIEKNNEGESTTLVTNRHFKELNVSLEKMHKDALMNSPVIRPGKICTLFETLIDDCHLPEESVIMSGAIKECPLYTVTTETLTRGAAVIAYEGMLESISKKLGGNFYIIPASRHEMLVTPEDEMLDIEKLQTIILQVNSTEIRPEDKLSDNLYHYDAEHKLFELASNYEKRIVA